MKLKIEFLPQGHHTVSSTKTSQPVLFSEIVTMFLRIHTTQINTLCIQNVEFLEVYDAYTNYSVLKGYCISQPYVTFSC